MWWVEAARMRRPGPSKTAGVQEGLHLIASTFARQPAQMAIPLQGIRFRNSWSLHEARPEASKLKDALKRSRP
jgi:hypothetical protein